VHDRRVRKAAAKQQLSQARRLLAAKPGYKLDHLVKERYVGHEASQISVLRSQCV